MFSFEHQSCIGHTKTIRHVAREYFYKRRRCIPLDILLRKVELRELLISSSSPRFRFNLNATVLGQAASGGVICTYTQCNNNSPCNIGTCNNGYCCSSAPIAPIQGLSCSRLFF